MRLRMLNLFSFIIIFTFIFSGCYFDNSRAFRQFHNDKNSDGKTVTITTSFYPIYIMALNIAKGLKNVKVVNLTKQTTGCLHDYSLTPDDLLNLENTDFFIINGAGMEAFMGKVLKQQPQLKIINSSKGIPLIKGTADTGENPHLWVSITNVILQVQNIGDQLALYDPLDAKSYKKNTQLYVNKLKALRAKMHEVLDNIKDRNIITFHEAFPYFAKEFNLNVVRVIEREPGSEPSAKELSDTIDIINTLKVKALFAEPQYSTAAADIIAKETGLKVYTLDPGVTGPMDENAYLSIMENNLKTLETALNGG